MLQVQHDDGPCVEAMRRGDVVRSLSASDLEERWPEVGAAVVAAGFVAVEAYPVRWRGRSVAGLNLFHTRRVDLDGGPDTPGHAAVAWAFADLLALALVSSVPSTHEGVLEQVEQAVRAREVVEMAKGVIAERESVSTEEAYDRLVLSAHRSRVRAACRQDPRRGRPARRRAAPGRR